MFYCDICIVLNIEMLIFYILYFLSNLHINTTIKLNHFLNLPKRTTKNAGQAEAKGTNATQIKINWIQHQRKCHQNAQ